MLIWCFGLLFACCSCVFCLVVWLPLYLICFMICLACLVGFNSVGLFWILDLLLLLSFLFCWIFMFVDVVCLLFACLMLFCLLLTACLLV